MEDIYLTTLSVCENYKHIQKEWIIKFYNHVKSLKIMEDCSNLTPAFIIDKLLQHLDCHSDVSNIAMMTMSDMMELSPCQCSIRKKNKDCDCPQRLLFICKLVPVDSPPGNIGVTDGGGKYIICHIPEECNKNVMSCLNKWSILTSWNMISTAGGKHIEMTGPLIVLDLPLKKDIQNVVTTTDAKVLLENKELLNIKPVNIYGKVVVVSEILRVKKDNLFWMRLTSDINIIIKKKEYLFWQKFLVPQKEYIFINMRSTTLQKGVGQPVKVFIPWKDSCIYYFTDEHFTVMSLNDWLLVSEVPDSVQEELSSKQGTSIIEEENQFSYQGVITSTEHSTFGVYELDNRIRLYLCYIPVLYPALRQGTKIMIYNAHFLKSKKNLRIVCCMSSCIKVTEFPATVSYSSNSTTSRLIQMTLWKYNYSLSYLTFVVDAILKLRKKCSSYQLEKFEEEILPVVFDLDRLPMTTRNHLMEVHGTNHTCCFIHEDKEYKTEFPDISEVDISEADDKMDAMAIARHDSNKDWNQSLYWSYITHQQTNYKVLFGEIHTCSISAKVQLRDQTGCIDCVVVETQSDHDLYHICNEDCCLSHQTVKSKFTCPRLHPHHNGCLVSITNFHIVKERFLVGNFKDIQNKDDIIKNKSKQLLRKYLLFSMTDVILISKPKTQQTTACNDEKLTVNQRGMTDQRMYVSRKESLHWNEQSRETSGFTFIIHTCMLLHNEKNNVVPEDCFHSSSSQIKTNEDGSDLSNKVNSGATEQVNKTCNTCQMFLFENTNVKYYNVIEAGCFYIFKHFDTVLIEKQKLPWQLKQCAKRAGNNMCNVFQGIVEIERDFHVQNKERENRTESVENILSDRFCTDYVSIVGRIVRRVHHAPDNINIVFKRCKLDNIGHIEDTCNYRSTLDNWQIQLQVKCVKSECEISVYLKLDNIAYPLGLIPGSVVYLEHIERRVSRKGIVYCQYSVVSSVTVLHYHQMSSDKVKDRYVQWNLSNQTHQGTKEMCRIVQDVGILRVVRTVEDNSFHTFDQPDILPSVYLVDLWQDKSIKDFSCVCFVQKVLKLSLKCVCQMCGSIIIEDCRNTLCHSDEYRFVTRISVIIDDGTCVAMVSCLDRDVQLLLLLCDDQWEALKLSIKSHGEVFLQQTFPDFGSTLEKFLFVLCDNPQFKRTVKMSLRSKQMSCKGREPYVHPTELLTNMSVEDFSEKMIDTGLSTIKTRCLPFLQLTCLKITDIDFMKQTISSLADQ